MWTGCYWRDGEKPPEAAPNVKVIVTAAGNKLILNDDEASITLSDPNGNVVTLNEAGITLSKASQQILIGDASVSVNDGALEVE